MIKKLFLSDSWAQKEIATFTVKTQIQNVFLIFDANKNFTFFAVGKLDCYAVFSSADMSYVGTLCPNGVGRYNWFSPNGEWLYFFS